MAARGSIPDFSLSNLRYATASVRVRVANPDGTASGVDATLFANPTGPDTLPNPQTLDPTGKFQQPVYIQEDVVLQVTAVDNDFSFTSGVVGYGGASRGVYAITTRYNRNDYLIAPAASGLDGNVYRVESVFDSTNFAADVADATKLSLHLDYVALQALALAAVPFATTATDGTTRFADQTVMDALAAANRSVTPAVMATHTAKGKHALWIPAGALRASITSGAAPGIKDFAAGSIKPCFPVMDFADGVIQSAHVSLRLPEGWAAGSTVTYRFLWLHEAGAGVVRWLGNAKAYADGESLDAVHVTTVGVDDTGLGANVLCISAETAPAAADGPAAAGEWVDFMFRRHGTDAADTLAATARLIGVVIYYTTAKGVDS